MSTPDITTDIAIIGAGAAGTYCAYRLTQETDQSIAVFETNDRVGGRLWSHHWPAADTMVELGGEAFSPSHAIVAGLTCTELGLEIEPHDAFNTLNRMYLRNRLARPSDMKKRSSYPQGDAPARDAKLRYFLDDSYFEKPQDGMAHDADDVADPFETTAIHLLKRMPKEVGEIFGALCQAYIARTIEVAGVDEHNNPLPLRSDQVATFMTRELYDLMGQTIHALDHSTFKCPDLTETKLGTDRIPTYELDFWSVVVNDLGQEAYALFRSAGYDNTSALSFNLAELMGNLLLGALLGMAAPNFWAIKGGFDQLPKTLMERSQQKGAELYKSHRLRKVARNPLTGLIELHFDGPGDRQIVCHTRKLIMSAPVSLFDHDVALDGFDPELTEAFRQRRAGVTPIPAGKLYMVYPEPWWSEMSDLAEGENPLLGYANTDMPARAVYYRGTIGDSKKGLVTGALTDSVSSDFWSGFLSPHSQIFPGASESERHQFAAPVHMVSACQRILQRMHKDALPMEIPAPELALYHEWRTAGGGWSAWKSGRHIHHEAALLRQPFRAGTVDEGLYCCGDSVAERHGWVENTLESAEAMLREAFELPKASWVPSSSIS